MCLRNVYAKFHQAKCSGSWVIVFTQKQKKMDDADNNTAIASMGSNYMTDS